MAAVRRNDGGVVNPECDGKWLKSALAGQREGAWMRSREYFR